MIADFLFLFGGFLVGLPALHGTRGFLRSSRLWGGPEEARDRLLMITFLALLSAISVLLFLQVLPGLFCAD